MSLRFLSVLWLFSVVVWADRSDRKTLKPVPSPTSPPHRESPSKPSPSPSTRPTTRPSFKPSAKPTQSPTKVPTTLPTALPSPIVTFTSTLTLSDLSSNLINLAIQNILIEAVALSMDIDESFVTYVSSHEIDSDSISVQTTQPYTIRRTDQNLLDDAVVDVTLQIRLRLSDTSYSTTSELYSKLTSKLNQAVTSDDMSDSLRRRASSEPGTRALEDVEVTQVDSSAPTIESAGDGEGSGSSGSGGSASLSANAIIGIIAGAAALVVLLLCLFCVCVFCGSKQAATAEVGEFQFPTADIEVMTVSPTAPFEDEVPLSYATVV